MQGRREARHPQQVAEAAFSFYRACYSGSSVSEPPGDQHRMNARPLASGSAGRCNRASTTAIRWVVCSGSSGAASHQRSPSPPSDPILGSASATGACAGACKGKSQDAQIRRSCPPPARPFCLAATADRRGGGGGSSLPPSSLQGLDADQSQPRVRRHRRRCFATTIALTVTETRSEAIGRPVPNATQHRYTDPTVAEERL